LCPLAAAFTTLIELRESFTYVVACCSAAASVRVCKVKVIFCVVELLYELLLLLVPLLVAAAAAAAAFVTRRTQFRCKECLAAVRTRSCASNAHHVYLVGLPLQQQLLLLLLLLAVSSNAAAAAVAAAV
jgi:hypothetical protein